MPIHIRLEVKDEIDHVDEQASETNDLLDTQKPEDDLPPIVVEVVEAVTLGRGEDGVLSKPVSDDPQSDSEFNRQMAMLKNIHVDLGEYHAHHRGVSRKHARITLRNTRLTVTDLSSTNGTYVNNEKLEPNIESPIKDGDELRLGFLTMVLTVI